MRFLFFLVSCFLFCIPTFGNNRSKGNEANKRYDSQSLLVLHKSLPTKTGRTHNAHSSHMAHASHASHYSVTIMKADSTARLNQRQINFIKKELCMFYKLRNDEIKVLRAYKADTGSIHLDLVSSSPIYKVNDVIYLEFQVDNSIYKYLIPTSHEIRTFHTVTGNKDYSRKKYNWMDKISVQ